MIPVSPELALRRAPLSQSMDSRDLAVNDSDAAGLARNAGLVAGEPGLWLGGRQGAAAPWCHSDGLGGELAQVGQDRANRWLAFTATV